MSDPSQPHDRSPISESRRLAWAVLSRAACGPSRPLQRLVAQLGVEDAAAAVEAGDVPVAVDRRVLERGNRDHTVRELAEHYEGGGRLITPEDSEWPTSVLADLGGDVLGADVEPDAVVPLALWVRGSASLCAVTGNAIAVLGDSASTTYGHAVTTGLVEDLAARGWAICVGANTGIDSVAHQRALASGVATVAVLGCGTDRGYLHHVQSLTEKITAAGLLVSEYPPRTPINRVRRLARTRLIAALSTAVVAVEASSPGEARETVRWANQLHRPAFALPGPITSAASNGCHSMIRSGAAELVTNASDIGVTTKLSRQPEPSVARGLSGDRMSA